jgi:hypothetical protein
MKITSNPPSKIRTKVYEIHIWLKIQLSLKARIRVITNIQDPMVKGVLK